MRTSLLCTLATLCLFAATGHAQSPYTLSHQGYLTDSGSTPINGPTALTFKMYKGGVEVWSESHASVPVAGGIYSVELGVVTPFDTLTFDVPIELGVKVGADPEISPRTLLMSSPNALNLRNMRVHRRRGNSGDTVNLIGGHDQNRDSLGVEMATISGGGRSTGPNIVRADGGTIGGGASNIITGEWATIGGGSSHRAKDDETTIGGGWGNTVDGQASTVSGGTANTATNFASTVGGGADNDALGGRSTVSGGNLNTALGEGSAIPGGFSNVAKGYTSIAAGYRAHANHDGAFVWNNWGTGTPIDTFGTTAANQFLIRAGGGVGIGTNTPDAALHVMQSALPFGGVSTLDVARDDVIIEDADAILGLYSDANGTWASGIVFGEIGALGVLANKWDILRETSGAGSSLIFRFGNDKDYLNHDTKLELTTGGSLIVPGDVNVTGNVNKSGGSFKIDHPLDPTNKYLYHSFVESPDMKNVYDGVAVLDSEGRADIDLPDYFEALNRDFRYQLTCIGAYAPVYVASEISDHRFTVAGGQPGMKVSWQVTGIRKDPYAEKHRIETEVDKPDGERGTYLHPEAYRVDGS